MMPAYPPGFYPPVYDVEGEIRIAEEDVADETELAKALANCARILMGPGLEAHAAAIRLESALCVSYTRACLRHLESLRKRPVIDSGRQAAEMLASLVQQRQSVEERLEKFEEMIEKIRESPAGEMMVAYIEGTMMPTLHQELEFVENRISQLQATIEKSGTENKMPAEDYPHAGGNA